ncbi:MAG: hypothetical protein AAFX81_03165 [Pseudomonadota bacterium]
MSRRAVLAVVLAVVLGLGGCAGVAGQGSDLAAFVDQGATRVAGDQRDELLIGNTVVADDVTVFYDPDGTKRVHLADGRSLERGWRIREDGVMCEELSQSGAEVCADRTNLYGLLGTYRAFRPDGSAAALTFRLERGEVKPGPAGTPAG